MLSHFTLLAQFGMCDVFLFATDPGASNQTNFTFVRMSFKISFRTGSHVSDGLMQTSYRDGSKGQDESDCSKNFFSLKEFAWTREGGGPGGGSLVFGLHRDLASNHPKSSQQHFSLHSTP